MELGFQELSGRAYRQSQEGCFCNGVANEDWPKAGSEKPAMEIATKKTEQQRMQLSRRISGLYQFYSGLAMTRFRAVAS